MVNQPFHEIYADGGPGFLPKLAIFVSIIFSVTLLVPAFNRFLLPENSSKTKYLIIRSLGIGIILLSTFALLDFIETVENVRAWVQSGNGHYHHNLENTSFTDCLVIWVPGATAFIIAFLKTRKKTPSEISAREP